MKYLTLLFVFANLWNAGSANACDCAPLSSVAQSLAEADEVFAGEILRIEPVTDTLKLGERQVTVPNLLVTFQVQEVWKGPLVAEKVLRTSPHGAACGFPFVEGESYLVYGYQGRWGLSTGVCERTKELSSADSDIDQLGPSRSKKE